MKIVILAAGMGKRLGNSDPKPLTPLTDDKTIMDLQTEKLLDYVDWDNMLAVVGYKKEQIINKFPNLPVVTNENYASTNTSKSLLKALKKIDDEDVLWLNGDIYFDSRVLDKLLKSGHSSVLVDNKKCGEEEVKYKTGENGFIAEISKEVENAEGEALGINLVKKNDLATFKKHLHSVNDNDYFEKALENMIKEDSVKINPINSEDHFCQEIDFPEDLEKVKKQIND